MIPVLMYHALEDRDHPSGITDEGERVYVLGVGQFEAQMGFLQEQGFHTCFLDDIQAADSAKGPRVILTFDDGRESDAGLVLPILKRFGFKACFFITTSKIGEPGYLSRGQVKSLADAGMLIGSHGVTHAYLEDLNDEAVRFEMAESRRMLAEVTGTRVDCFSVPGGRIRPHQCDIAAEVGYRAVFTSRLGALESGRPIFSVPRIALKRGHTLDDFRKIATLDSVYMLKGRLMKAALDLGKKAMGNRGYDMLRGWVLRN
jgi:peptidoglycan/xylan/chitin deacetylase (PgdA/CDA1 family)